MRETNGRHITRLVFSLLLVGVLFGCSLRVSPSDEQILSSSPQYPDGIEKVKLVPVIFNLELKQSNSPETEMVIDVLDDVTGLAYHINRYPLTRVSENHYSTALMLPQGGEVHYRYSSVKPIELAEVAANGAHVIYRSAYIAEGTVINDILAGWPNLAYNGDTGKLSGVISDAETDKPIPDVLVSLAGYQTFTDMTGRFFFDNVPAGIHNLVAASIDGSYQVFQQEANVVSSLATPAVIKMQPLAEVKITFVVTPPDDAVGAPIRLVGNYYQLGNAYTDLESGVSASASRLPLMSRMEDGRYSIEVTLHTGNFLRYKYTLGDGFTNAERDPSGEIVLRQFIVPKKNITVEDQISTWRIASADPANIVVTVPADTPIEDSISIQFKEQDKWNQPLPMWPMGSNQWMYLLFGDTKAEQPPSYRFCRNDQCQLAYDESSNANPYPVVFGNPIANKHEVSAWHLWSPRASELDQINQPIAPSSSKLSGVEFASYYTSSSLNRYRDILPELKSMGINWLILTPSWEVTQLNGLPYLDQDPSTNMLIADMKEIVRIGEEAGFSIGIYPQLNFPENISSWWEESQRSALWWQQWYSEYERFLMNYIMFAADNKLDQFIIGGPGIAPSLPGALQTVGDNFGTPKTSEDIWATLLDKINTYFSGETLWGIPLGQGSLPEYSFYANVDGFYLELQSSDSDFNATQDSVARYIDSWILSFRDTYDKAIYFGLNSPSITTTESINDMVISPADKRFGGANVNLDLQDYFYQIYEPVLTDRNWISGVSTRGFYPVVKITDFSSSVYGKPAMDQIWYYNSISK